MKITLKLFSGLVEYLPAEAEDNAVAVVAADSMSAHMLIDQYHLPRAQAQVVMVNGDFLPIEKRDTPLRDGDVVSIWPSIHGRLIIRYATASRPAESRGG